MTSISYDETVLIEPGATIANKYRVTRILGEGGMGLVYEAKHEALGTAVAIKVLRDEVMKDQEAVARFAREARAAAVLRGPHAARILDVGEAEGGQPFMVMELLDGNDLGDELERRGPLPVLEAIDYVAQACDAIAEAHDLGIVHRDLKPANLFLIRIAGRRMVKVLDFGISRYDGAGEQRVTQTQSAFGTPLYMSPEALRSAKHTDARSDVWAFGVILYELLTGMPPFLGDTATAVAVSVTVDKPKALAGVRPDIPPELDAIIARAMDKDPSRRFQHARELGEALHALMDKTRASLAPPSTGSTPARSDFAYAAAAAPAATAPVPVLTTRTEPTESATAERRRGAKVGAILVVAVAIASLAITLSVVALLKAKKPAESGRSAGVAHVDRGDSTTEATAATTQNPAIRVEAQLATDAATASATIAPSAAPSTAATAQAKPTAEASAPPPAASAATASPPARAPSAAPSSRPAPGAQPVHPGGNPLTL